MEALVKNIFGKEFLFRVEELSFVSVLSAGYAINPEGNFILIKDNEDHSTIFSDYLNKYLDNQVVKTYESTNAMVELIKLNHVIYFGVKPSDIAKGEGGLSEGLCFIVLPEDYKNILTEQQKESIRILINTNQSIFGDREKVSLKIYETFFHKNPLDKNNFIEFLSHETKKSL